MSLTELLVFACFLFGFFPIVYLFYPETTQRTLEDMDVTFRTNPSMFVFRNRNLTQRERPQDFIDAERARIEQRAMQLKQEAGEKSVGSEEVIEKV